MIAEKVYLDGEALEQIILVNILKILQSVCIHQRA